MKFWRADETRAGIYYCWLQRQTSIFQLVLRLELEMVSSVPGSFSCIKLATQ